MSKAILAILSVVLLGGAACEKKPAKSTDTGAVNALDRAGSDQGGGAVDTTPLDGVDVSKLSKDKQDQFYKLIASLTSPCGKAHSLRTSVTTDTSCKRAPFAVRYVLAFLEDEATEDQIREFYDKKYKAEGKVKIDVSKAPAVGSEDAPIRLVEFFDYECPHCQVFKGQLEKVLADRQGKVVVHYMNFPLQQHHDSKSAAQAAVAAHQLGKFHEMHDLLFAKSPAHSHDDVMGYAKEIGLDPTKFEAAYNAAGAQVAADLAQGEAAGVDSTPTLYFNDRKYEGPMYTKYIELWVDEELAVNR
ncbi:MAG: thioredoxin domain-containing protein [Kofleriaceae bacterium]|nr:thioredoxin domain-containing protein [Kofleriaceae bacterium]